MTAPTLTCQACRGLGCKVLWGVVPEGSEPPPIQVCTECHGTGKAGADTGPDTEGLGYVRAP